MAIYIFVMSLMFFQEYSEKLSTNSEIVNFDRNFENVNVFPRIFGGNCQLILRVLILTVILRMLIFFQEYLEEIVN